MTRVIQTIRGLLLGFQRPAEMARLPAEMN
jgi:hypothetical protein